MAEGRQMTIERGRRRRCEGAAAAEVLRDLVKECDGLAWAVQYHFGEDAALVAGETLAQPTVDDLEEGEIGLIAIHDAGARVDVGFGGIGLDQALAEAVDGRASDLVDCGTGCGEIIALGLGQTIGQCHAQFGRDMACREIGDKIADTREKFARRQFGEGDGSDGAWRNPFGEHGGDAPSHDGGLARTGASFDQDGAIVAADRVAAGAVILENFGHAGHYSASQT
jgi:hypothetical protein